MHLIRGTISPSDLNKCLNSTAAEAAGLDKKFGFDLEDRIVDLDPQNPIVVDRAVTLTASHWRSGGLSMSAPGTGLIIQNTDIHMKNFAAYMAGGGTMFHVNYGRFYAADIFGVNSSAGHGALFAFDSLSTAGAQVGGAYTHDISGCKINAGANLCKHLAVGVTYLPISSVTGTFQLGETITASGGKSAEIVAKGSGWLKLGARVGSFNSASITGGTSGATATAGTMVNTLFNAHSFSRSNVICQEPFLYFDGGAAVINGGVYQSGQPTGTGTLIQMQENAQEFSIAGHPYIERFDKIALGNGGAHQILTIDSYHNDTNTSEGTGVTIVKGATPFASQAEAEAGTENTKNMTALRTAQAITALGGGGAGPFDGLTLLNTQNITTTGTYTKTSGTTKIRAKGVGGGGGGGYANSGQGGAGGGGAGGYCESILDATGISTVSVTIGAGGGEFTDGGVTSFGSSWTANGGVKGSLANVSSGSSASAGGTASGGTETNTTGGAGEVRAANSAFGTKGGDSVLGTGGARANSAGSGNAGSGYGSGGGGALSGVSNSGGHGAGGKVIIEEYGH